MLIEVELTPNPATLRFLLPRPLPLEASIAFDRESGRRPRIADRLLLVPGVESLLFARDFVAASRGRDAAGWPDLRGEIVAALMDALEEGEEAELEHWTEEQIAPTDPIEEQIVELLRTRIAPSVARDGGDITLLHYRDGVATVEMRGACGGCPSSLMTLKRSVETVLKRYIPELERVEAALEANPQKPFWKSMLAARGARFRSG